MKRQSNKKRKNPTTREKTQQPFLREICPIQQEIQSHLSSQIKIKLTSNQTQVKPGQTAYE